MVRSGAISLLFLFSFHWVLAQENRYMVFFSDKDNSSYSVSNPEEFLSSKALSRRVKHALSIDESDLPVNDDYIQSVKSLGASTYFRTKWMNGILVEMIPSLVSSVELLSFVTEVRLVAEGAQLLDSELIKPPTSPPFDNTPETSNTTDTQNNMVGVSEMHEQHFMGEGVMVAILDSGFPNLGRIGAFSHLYDNNQIKMTKDYTINQEYIDESHNHGLKVLSIIAAERSDFQGIIPEANYLLFITEDTRDNTETWVEEFNWLFAAEAADSAGVDIISTSLGYSVFDDPFEDYTYEDMDGQTTIISQAAGLAFSKGILVVTSAGNAGNNAWQYITSPADHPEVLAVGGVTTDLTRVSLSSFGPNSNGDIKPDVMALGSGNSVINDEGDVQFGSGTSFSAPIVTGIAGGLLQAFPNKTNNEIADAIRASGTQSLNPDHEMGFGIPNFQIAFDILNHHENNPDVEDALLIFPNPTKDDLVTVKVNETNLGLKSQILLTSIEGRILFDTEITPTEVKDNIQLDLSQNKAGIYIFIMINSNGRFAKKLIKY